MSLQVLNCLHRYIHVVWGYGSNLHISAYIELVFIGHLYHLLLDQFFCLQKKFVLRIDGFLRVAQNLRNALVMILYSCLFVRLNFKLSHFIFYSDLSLLICDYGKLTEDFFSFFFSSCVPKCLFFSPCLQQFNNEIKTRVSKLVTEIILTKHKRYICQEQKLLLTE